MFNSPPGKLIIKSIKMVMLTYTVHKNPYTIRVWITWLHVNEYTWSEATLHVFNYN